MFKYIPIILILFFALFFTVANSRAQDSIALDEIIGPTGNVDLTNTHITFENNKIIFGEDTGGTDRRLLYWDNANDLWIGPDSSLGALPSGGDLILRVQTGVTPGTEAGMELDGTAVANQANLIPLSGDTINLGSASLPFGSIDILGPLRVYDNGIANAHIVIEDGAGSGAFARLWAYSGTMSSGTQDYFLPLAAPASTECMEMTNTGQMQLSGGTCAGGSSSGTNDEVQFTDNAGGFTSVLNTRYDSANTALNLSLHINPHTDSGFDIGTWDKRHDQIWADNVETEELFIVQQANSAHSFLFDLNGTNILRLKNSASTPLLIFDEASATVNIQTARPIYPSTPVDLGTASLYWDEMWINDIEVNVELRPDIDKGANIGTSSTDGFNQAWIDNLIIESDINPEAGGGADIGTNSLYFGNVYAAYVLAPTGAFNAVGSATTGYDEIYGNTVYADNLFRADTDRGADLGSSTYYFDEQWIETIYVGDATATAFDGVIQFEGIGTSDVSSMTFDTINTSGSLKGAIDVETLVITTDFYNRTFTGAGGPSCTNISDGWMGLNTNDTSSSGTEVLWVCSGGTAYGIALSATP